MGNSLSSQRLGGYRVVKKWTTDLAVECFSDYIVAVNEHALDGSRPLTAILNAVIGDSCDLQIYNILENRVRKIGCCRTVDGKFTLGIIVRYEFVEDATSRVIKVMSVKTGFPAQQAGLTTDDYLIGLEDGTVLDDVEPIYAFLRQQNGDSRTGGEQFGFPAVAGPTQTELAIHVYNTGTHKLRQVTLVPVLWGGHQVLGAELELQALPLRPGIGLTPYVLGEKKIEASTQTKAWDEQLVPAL